MINCSTLTSAGSSSRAAASCQQPEAKSSIRFVFSKINLHLLTFLKFLRVLPTILIMGSCERRFVFLNISFEIHIREKSYSYKSSTVNSHVMLLIFLFLISSCRCTILLISLYYLRYQFFSSAINLTPPVDTFQSAQLITISCSQRRKLLNPNQWIY